MWEEGTKAAIELAGWFGDRRSGQRCQSHGTHHQGRDASCLICEKGGRWKRLFTKKEIGVAVVCVTVCCLWCNS